MILWLASNLFKDENSRYLDTLRLNALNNKVFLKFDIEDPNILRWIATNNKSDWEEIYRCWISDATKFKQTNIAKVDNDIAISDLHSEIPTLTLQDGAAVSSMPLFLVFENAHNDVEFMKCIVDKTTRAQICRKLNLNLDLHTRYQFYNIHFNEREIKIITSEVVTAEKCQGL